MGANSYGAVSVFGPTNTVPQLGPSLSGNYIKNANLSLLWYPGSNQIDQVSYISGAWGATSTLASNGQTPQLVLDESGVGWTSK